MNPTLVYTARQFAELLQRRPSTVYLWIRRGKVKARPDAAGRIQIDAAENQEFTLAQLRLASTRPTPAWLPEGLEDYGEWHQVLDELAWLVKTCYTAPAEIKRKSFRMECLLANYLHQNAFSLSRLRAELSSVDAKSRQLITDDLKRGWYNELSYNYPLRPSTLGLSFADVSENKPAAGKRFAFPSWRIAQAYYATYFFLRGATLYKQAQFRIEEHGAAISAFKNCAVRPMERAALFFPFNIRYEPGVRFDVGPLRAGHLRFAYSRHPRAPHRLPAEIAAHLHRVFKRRALSRAKPAVYTLFDYLHDLRVWANYLDIDNLLRLWGDGFKCFMDHNLALVLFFVGAAAELSYLATYGERRFMSVMQQFYDLFVSNNPSVDVDFVNTPVYQRLAIYRALDLVDGGLRLKDRENVNSLQLPQFTG